jgi:GT2 family glycosyltransferase
MNYIHFIPHVNRPDLTILALKSIPNLWENTILIDNSDTRSLAEEIGTEINFGFTVVIPPVPQTTAQTYNWMRFVAIEQKTDFVTFMHNDCEVKTPNGDKFLIEKAESLFSDDTQKIGWVHHDSDRNEDLFCAYKTEMLQDVGEWDWLCFPFYYLDIDYMQRVRKKGWTISRTPGIMCEHHNVGSSTIKSSKLRDFANAYYFNSSDAMFKIKWQHYHGDWSNL